MQDIERPRTVPNHSPGRFAASCVLSMFLAAIVPAMAQVPVDALFSGFRATGEFLFELDGEELMGAEILSSERAAAYLVLTPRLSSPLLISPRTQSVESVPTAKIVREADGSIGILADAAFNRESSFDISAGEVRFEIEGKSARLKPKPPLLGFQTSDELKSHKPEYSRLAAEYSPKSGDLEALRSQRGARFLVYFGTWCPVCGRLVPRVLRVEEELAGSNIVFQYYGLPRPLTDDPVTERDSVHGVPTAIVYVDDKPIGRFGGAELNVPESSLVRLLRGQ